MRKVSPIFIPGFKSQNRGENMKENNENSEMTAGHKRRQTIERMVREQKAKEELKRSEEGTD